MCENCRSKYARRTFMTGHARRPPRLLGGRHGRLAATACKSCHVHSCDVLACGRTCGRVAMGGLHCMHAMHGEPGERTCFTRVVHAHALLASVSRMRTCACMHGCIMRVRVLLRSRSITCDHGHAPINLGPLHSFHPLPPSPRRGMVGWHTGKCQLVATTPR